MKNKYVKVFGMHCANCENTIKIELLKNKNIKEVKFEGNIACITYDNNLSNKEIINSITNLSYETRDDYISDDIKNLKDNIKIKEFIIILSSVLIIWFLIRKIFNINIFNIIPNIDSSVAYGYLFIIGIFTSIHCISMCGAINLIAAIDSKKSKNFKRPILYNLGRVVSYTIIGALAGGLGSVLSINSTARGIIILISSIIMFMVSLSLLGIINFKINYKLKKKSKNAFVIGLLNGLMPCGPLQAMEVYALSTSSVARGAISMFLFSLGTVPFMLFVGILFNIFQGKRKILLNKIASILVLVLSIFMFNRGLLALNIDLSKSFKNYDSYTASKMYDDIQIVEFDLDYNSYEDIILQVGVPTKIIIHADKKHITGCNNEIIMSYFDIDKKLEEGDNIIEFTPTKTGVYTYTCFMNMIKNNIKVIDDRNYFKKGGK